jgi:hypothetical protein
MSINDLFRSCALILPATLHPTSSWCLPFGYILAFTTLSNCSWALCICIALYKIVVKKQAINSNFHRKWFIISYPILGLIQALPFISNSFGYYDGICSLKNDFNGNIWRFCIIYLPYWIFILVICLIYRKLHFVIRRKEKDPSKILILRRGYMYPFILMVLLLPLSVVRTVEIFDDSCVVHFFARICDSLLATHGLANAIALVSNNNIRRALRVRIYATELLEKTEEALAFSFLEFDQYVK